MDSVRGTPRDRPIQASSQFHLIPRLCSASSTLAHHLKSVVHSLLSGAVQTASEWLIEGIKGLCGRDT